MRQKQPRLRFWLAEFFGKAETVTGDVWWEERPQDDGSIRRVPLVPIEPTADDSSRLSRPKQEEL